MPMTVEDPNYARNRELLLTYTPMKAVIETKGNPANYVLYKKQRYALEDALCLILYQGTMYAVIEADPLPLSTAQTSRSLKKVGEVLQNRKEENDLTDLPEEKPVKAFPVYQRGLFHHYLAEIPEHEGLLYPMLKIRQGINN